MPRNKKILLVAGGAVLCLLAALLVLPVFFSGPIEARVRAEIEKATKVRVSWNDVGLTFFSDFPHPTFSLRGLAVVGTGRFEGDTLAAVDDFRLAFNGTSLIGALLGSGPVVIRSVDVTRPTVNLQADADGTASWDVLPEATDAESDGTGRAVAVSLRRLALTDGRVLLNNEESGVYLVVEGLSHDLRGNFSREQLVAESSTHADAVTLRMAGTPYLGGVSFDFDADLDVDMAEQRARLVDNQLRMNDLVLLVQGELARVDEDLVMDLTFDAPSTEFGQVLSLVPAVYAQDFASLETSGTFSVTGRIDGAYGRNAFPSFAFDLSVQDGRFRYPDLPLPAEAITADLSITNPGGSVDSTVVDLSRFHMEIGDQPFDASLTLRTPVSDPEAEVAVNGTLDLADVARTIRLEGVDGLAGVITADASMHARRSDVDSARYDRIAADGAISARGVTLRGEALPQPVDVREGAIRLTPQTARLTALDAQLGSSDLRATGQLDNLLGFALGGQPLRGSADFSSNRFVLDEWRSGNELEAIPVPANLDLTLDGTIGELVFNGLEMTNARGTATVRDQRLTLDGFGLETLGGRVGMDGYYETLDPTRPTFAFDLELDSLDVAGAAEAFVTVRTLAPVAQYARGTFSSDLSLTGALGPDLSPELDVLDGDGSLSTSRVAIEGFPMLERLAETLQLQRLAAPTVEALRSTIHIQDGRLMVEPFDVGLGGLSMSVSGSNGIDQSVDYTLGLRVPRAGFADDVLSGLASRAGALGAGLASVDPVPVNVRVTGTIMQPSLGLGLGSAAGSLTEAAGQAVGGAVQQRVDEAQAAADAATEEALQRARAQGDSLVAEAERQADAIRAEAARAADEIRAEGNRAAEEVLARATNPLARTAAEPAANRIRQEAEQRAAQVEREADQRATALVAAAEERSTALLENASR